MDGLRRRARFPVAALLALLALFLPAPVRAGGAPEDPVDFDREIRPLLARRCLLCHGFDPSTRKAGLRLDGREGATAPRADGPPAIVPGDRAASALFGRITRTDDDRMPPADREPLEAAEIALLGRWIDEGAGYATPWAWRPVADPPPPPVADERWARDPLDRFILARLEAAGLAPAPESSRRDWLRRVTFDLTGLPPAPAEVNEFLADERPGAHERVVARLLASPHYGERWGRHWLDLVRYAETHGHEFDYPIEEAWRYRDAVVRAWNDDVPYDVIVREHIAGDLVAPPRRHPELGTDESIVMTGFWCLSQGTHGPVDVRQDQADRADNQIDVLAKTFLGLTVSCARCHDHKFDPILTADYYALAGFLRSSRRALVPLDPHGAIAAAAGEIEAAQRALEPLLAARLEGAAARPWAAAARRARALLDETRASREAERPADRELFDFEGDSFEPWTVEGDAFGARPHRLDELVLDQAVGVHGAGVANSHDRRPGTDSAASDRRTGRLESPEFAIDRPILRFAIGGGEHAETCVNLRVAAAEGAPQVVRTMSGRNTTAMHEVEWDVAELIGQSARLELVDRHTGGWGHIAADRFRLAAAPADPIPDDAAIAHEAAGLGIAPAELAALLAALAAPLPVEAASSEESAAPTPAAAGAEGRPPVLFADFESPDAFAGWFPAGVAFGAAPVPRGALSAAPDGVRASDAGCADSGRLGPRARGSLRSPSFTIAHDWVHLRARGRGGQMRVIIDDYYLDTYNALLFGGMAIAVEEDRWRHYRHDLSRYRGERAYLEWNDEGDGSLAVDEVWFSNDPEGPAEAPLDLALDAERTTAEWLAEPKRRRFLLARGVPILGDLAEPGLAAPLARLRAAHDAMPEPVRALALVEGTPADERVFIRGQHRTFGEVAPRRLVASLLPDQAPIGAGSGRLELAERILASPLPFRVMANRVWLHLLGEGIVATPDDFGALGRAPTHPELLDHLAGRLREDPSLKRLIASIVLSATYRQSARAADPRAAELDPENALFHRRPPRRLDAEEVRDAILAASGRLDRTIGGPPVEVYLTEYLSGRGRPEQGGPLDGAGRRTIYLAIRRNFLSPFLLAFDAPVPFTTCGRRSVSNVPAQALALRNDPFVHEQAGVWAERLLREFPGDDARLDRMVLEAYARPPTDAERTALRGFLGERPDRGAWKDAVHALIASQEFLFLE